MTDMITVTGVVATEPTKFVTDVGVPITNFRLASNQRRFDRDKQQWVDIGTNWYRVSAFRQLALHTLVSLHKGERVVVTGRLKVREWTAGEKNGTAVEIDADSIGHDLTFGTSMFTRSIVPGNQQTDADAPALTPSDAAAIQRDSGSDSFAGDVAADRAAHENDQSDEDATRRLAQPAAEVSESALTATPF